MAIGSTTIGQLPIGAQEPSGGSSNLTLTANAGGFTLTGEPIVLGIGLPVTNGTFTLTGEATTFGLNIAEAAGTFTLSGNQLTFTIPGQQVLTADFLPMHVTFGQLKAF
jgi:hypothetical protein